MPLWCNLNYNQFAKVQLSEPISYIISKTFKEKLGLSSLQYQVPGISMTIKQHPRKEGFLLGWREWVALPKLGIPAIKAKIDTGARTSALHTFWLETFHENSQHKVRFSIHPVQKRADIEIICTAEIIDERIIADSGGHREKRYVILTPIQIGDQHWPIEITLTNRDTMQFRMLLGRTALVAGGVKVAPDASYLASLSSASPYPKHQRYNKPKKN